MNPALPFLMLAAHLVGDFVLQNNDMAANKAKSSRACLLHVNAYILLFVPLVLYFGLPQWAMIAIAAQHYLQDRYALHLRWMKWFGQTTPDKWPTGPLCVDQALHIGFMALVVAFI